MPRDVKRDSPRDLENRIFAAQENIARIDAEIMTLIDHRTAEFRLVEYLQRQLEEKVNGRH